MTLGAFFFYLKDQHIGEIFSLWFKCSHESLSQENIDALRNLNYEDVHNRFFTHNGNLYMISNVFYSTSRFDIAASMDLSKYEIGDYEESDDNESISSISSDGKEVQLKKRTKVTSKKWLKKRIIDI